MDLIVLSTRFQPDPEKIAAKYAVDSDDPLYSRIKDACQEVGEIGKPVACFKEAKVDEWGSDYVVIDGVRFSGKFIADRLKNSKIVTLMSQAAQRIGYMGKKLRRHDGLFYDDIRRPH